MTKYGKELDTRTPEYEEATRPLRRDEDAERAKRERDAAAIDDGGDRSEPDAG